MRRQYNEMDANYDTIFEDTVTKLKRQLPTDVTLFADHINEYPHPRQVANGLDIEHVPGISMPPVPI